METCSELSGLEMRNINQTFLTFVIIQWLPQPTLTTPVNFRVENLYKLLKFAEDCSLETKNIHDRGFFSSSSEEKPPLKNICFKKFVADSIFSFSIRELNRLAFHSEMF